VETSLIATKLYVPPARVNLVDRQRLLNKLNAALKYSLVLVSAPAGFGKTTLVSEWIRHIEQKGISTAWLSLDEQDNDSARFWEYFISAMQTSKPMIGKTAMSFLNSNEKPDIDAIVTMVINDLTTIPMDFTLVLEDYHCINDQEIHRSLNFLLERLPPRMHLVIVTRSDPALRLAHFRGKGVLSEIRAEELRFTIKETNDLLKAMDCPDLSSENLRALNARTEGWVVGLKMAFLSLKAEKDVARFIADFTGSNRHIMDYLMEEVLQQQSPAIQEFLLQTSILERLNASLCDSVTKYKDSQEVLLILEQANLFIIPLDGVQEWYRYEHLFADFLHRLLMEKHGQTLISDLHNRASLWYEENNYLDLAISHALLASNWERAIKLLYEPDWKRLKVADLKVAGWFGKIPVKILKTHPLAYLQYAFALIETYQFERSDSILNYLEQINVADTEFQGLVAMAQTHIGRVYGDAAKYIEKARKALSLTPTIDNETRKIISYFLGPMLVDQRRFKESEPLFITTIQDGLRTNDYSATVLPLGFLGYVTTCRGKLRQAAHLCQRALNSGELSSPSTFALTILGWIEYEWNDIDTAAKHINQALELNIVWNNNVIGIMANIVSSLIYQAQGNSVEAEKAMHRSDQACQAHCSPEEIARNVGCHLALALAQNDISAIKEWGNKVMGCSQILPPEVAHMPYRFLITKGEKCLAAEQMKSAYDLMAADGYYPLVKIRLTQTLAAPDIDTALPFLAEALKLGEPEGYVRTFVDEGKLIKPLLKRAVPLGIMPEYAGKLLSIIQAEEHQRHAKKCKIISSSASIFGLLSKRELEVMQLIEKGFSDRQIADKLVISLSTAKTHVHHIFSKLNVKDRLQAVNRAKDLQLK